MAHLSENAKRLGCNSESVYHTSDLAKMTPETGSVYLLWFPSGRNNNDALQSGPAFRSIADFSNSLPEDATVCILTTPPDAALLLPYLEKALKFQLWIAVKTEPEVCFTEPGNLPQRHAALLVLTRYRGSLRHTKTRIGYTYCPACGKTSKDYGGKKHTYHEYGTLMSDIWRDIDCNPNRDIEQLVNRLRDLFGLETYNGLHIVDLRSCADLRAGECKPIMKEKGLPIVWEEKGLPTGSQLLHRDCLEALRSIPDNSIDFCFADPPYNIQKKYDTWNDALESVEYFEWCDRWLSELCRVLKPGRTLSVLNIPLWAVRHYQHLISIMSYQNWIAWEGLSLPVRMIMPAHYAIICFSKGAPRPLPGLQKASNQELEYVRPLEENYCLRASCISRRRRRGQSDTAEVSDLWWDVHRLKHNSRRVDHPCQLPPLLMRRLYALFTKPGEVILDCFNGAGTSTLVAQQMGRNFVGIELSSQYHQLAKERHEQLARGEDPFGKVDAIPAAKNSRVRRVTKQKYSVSKKKLQLDVKRIAQELGRMPTREDVAHLGQYPIDYFDTYFVSWGEVCAAARTTGMSELPPDYQSLESESKFPQLELTLD